jgi:uncharacterized protein (DUF362 family)
MEALVRAIIDFSPRITFVESDGGSYAWTAEQAMRGHGIPTLCKRYGVRMMNLTRQPTRRVQCELDNREIDLELSAEMIEESDLFITMPVPKMHVNTYMSLGFKNQWGCLPDVKRLRRHPDFDHTVLAINRVLRTRIAVYDGTYFLNRTGPMDGDPIEKNMMIVSDGVGAGDLVCSQIMQIPARRSSHLRLAQKIGMMPEALDHVTVSSAPDKFYGEPFYLRRSLFNWIGVAAFQSKWLTRVIYDSGLAKPIHEAYYMVQGRPPDVSPKW